MRAPHVAFREAVALKLANTAPTVASETDRAQHARAPRFGWLTVGADDATRASPRFNGGTEEYSGTDAVAFEVECWGYDEESAWIMRLALITALRDVTNARGYKLGQTRVVEPPVNNDGYALLTSFVVMIATPDLVIPSAPLAPISVDDDRGDLTTIETKTIDTASLEGWSFDAAGAVSGDGKLTAEET